MDDEEWFEFLGIGTVQDLSDRDDPPPRLAGMRSVSNVAATALHRAKPAPSKPVGFVHGQIVGRTR